MLVPVCVCSTYVLILVWICKCPIEFVALLSYECIYVLLLLGIDFCYVAANAHPLPIHLIWLWVVLLNDGLECLAWGLGVDVD